jgi:hypothetical protein
MKYILTREVLISECKWLNRDFIKGEILYFYEGATYNCISKRGFPFSEKLNEAPFFEIPQNAVTTLKYDMSGNPIGPFEVR